MRVSVVIPTFNAGPDISRLIEKLRSQKPRPPDEILAIDSGSTDDTCQRVRDLGGRVIEWKAPYDHGLTRDAGISASSGEIVFLTVQDAVPASDDWLQRIVSHFADPAVAGVSSRQIPPPDGPVELQIKAELDAKQSMGEPLRIALSDHPNYARYTPSQKLELYRFDNVCAAMRRSVWEKVPFGACQYAEDYQWARRALEAGYTLVRDPSAPVIHAHRRRFVYEFRRGLLDAWVLDEVFGYRYGFLNRLNRAKVLVGGTGKSKSSGFLGRLGAVKTYTAHVLARAAYLGYRIFMKPLGLGNRTLRRLTRNI